MKPSSFLTILLTLTLTACGYHLRGQHFSESELSALNLNYVENEATFANILQKELSLQGIKVFSQSKDTPYSLNLYLYEQAFSVVDQNDNRSNLLLEASIQVQLLKSGKSIWGTEKMHESLSLTTERTGTELDTQISLSFLQLQQRLSQRIRLTLEALGEKDDKK
jgi:outer membrane lipopolysaccharide assembly protein LptE/RlpB